MRVAIVGYGTQGHRHARILGEFGIEVVTIDPDPFVGADYLDQFTCARCTHAIIACPIPQLATEAFTALLRGCHVLVEKPMAIDLEEARGLVELSREQGKKLFVGYTEVHNPAVKALGAALPPAHEIARIETRRIGLQRTNDVGPLLDLAVHDLAVAHTLGFRATGVVAHGEDFTIWSGEDWELYAVAHYHETFKQRSLKVVMKDGPPILLDYQQQAVSTGPVTNAEPLKEELWEFLAGRGFGAEDAVDILRWTELVRNKERAA